MRAVEAVATATGQTQLANVGQHLNVNQRMEMVTRPDMILQFAHHLGAEAQRNGNAGVEVRAFVRASLNGRAHQMLVDPSVNLWAEERTLGSAKWIMPLAEPLRRKKQPARDRSGQLPGSIPIPNHDSTNSLPR